MIKGICCSTIVFLLFSLAGFAQPWLTGRIRKKASLEIVPGVNIKNSSSKKYNTSDAGGNYRIAATVGDSLVFSSAGYRPDTIVVSQSMLVAEYDIYLAPNVVVLASVEIDALSRYEADSLKRTEDYEYILNKKHLAKLVKNKKISNDPPGLILSPVSFFSRHEKQKRRLKRRIKEEDENEYIDARFPPSKVSRVTKLTGDSLQYFMLLYRPGYTFCRKATNQDILLYINDKLILFRKGRAIKNY